MLSCVASQAAELRCEGLEMVWEYVPEGRIKLSDAASRLSEDRSISVREARDQLRTALARAILIAVISDQYGDEIDIPTPLWRGRDGDAAFNLGRMQFSVGAHWSDVVGGEVYIDLANFDDWINGRSSINSEQRNTGSHADFGNEVPDGIHPGAYKWWLERAIAEKSLGRTIKKTAEFQVCPKEVGCTYRQADAAFKSLPHELVRKKGSRDL